MLSGKLPGWRVAAAWIVAVGAVWFLGGRLFLPAVAQPPQRVEAVTRLGPRVLEFSRRKSVRGVPEAKLDVVIYALPQLSAAQKSALEDLGVDPVQAAQGGMSLTTTPGVIKALSGLDFVVHIDDRHLIKMDSTIARSVAVLKSSRPGAVLGRTEIEVEVTLRPALGSSEKARLAEFGFEPGAIAFDRLVGKVDIHQLERLADLDFVLSISQPDSVESQRMGVAPHSAHLPPAGLKGLHRRGLRGAGVKVAVIDSGFDPGDPTLAAGRVIHTETFSLGLEGDRAHGTAVAAVLHSVAPAAELILLSVGSRPGQSVYRAIDRALELDADVINISLGKAVPEEGFLRGDGPVAQVIAKKIKDKGTTLVVAAGNYNRALAYVPDGAGQIRSRGSDSLLFVGPAKSPEIRFFWPRSLPESSVFVAWDDHYRPEERRSSDLTLEVWDRKRKRLVAFSNDNQLAAKPPREVLRLVRAGSPRAADPGFVSVPADSDQFFLRVRTNMPARTLQGRAIRVGVGMGSVLAAPSNRLSINAAPYALTGESIMVGAVSAQEGTAAIEPHSGRGPQQDQLPRPDVVAPAILESGGRVWGTSAATPYAAGVIALLKGVRPALTTPEIKAFLRRGSLSVPAGSLDPALTIDAALSMDSCRAATGRECP